MINELHFHPFIATRHMWWDRKSYNSIGCESSIVQLHIVRSASLSHAYSYLNYQRCVNLWKFNLLSTYSRAANSLNFGKKKNVTLVSHVKAVFSLHVFKSVRGADKSLFI